MGAIWTSDMGSVSVGLVIWGTVNFKQEPGKSSQISYDFFGVIQRQRVR